MKRNKKNIFRISFGIISLNLPAEGDMSPSLQVLHILCMQSFNIFNLSCLHFIFFGKKLYYQKEARRKKP